MIVFGEGGGFTGAWSGFTLHADGNVLHWQGKSAEAEPRSVGRLKLEEVAALWQEIGAQEFFALAEGEPGNLTRFVRVTAAGRTHETRWVPGGEGVSIGTRPTGTVA